MSSNDNPGNFANRSKEEVREIAAKGGRSSGGNQQTSDDSYDNSSSNKSSNTSSGNTGNDNPGNFANRPKDEVREIAAKGGHASHSGGFASMDPDKQREIASMGGKASSGSFEPGSEKAREAGRKGGSK
ncbi:hypothetical protein F5B17DRAFT_68397 [Nemania serpens]|nr:hypothetical protein F5B17DRAFT_68397 [Nemania serpens]